MEKDKDILRYEEAVTILPVRLRRAALAVTEEEKKTAEELRLRAGRPMTVLLPLGERALDVVVEPEVLDDIADGVAIGFPDIIAAQQARGRKVSAYTVSEEDWLDMGQMEELKRMEEKLR